MRIKKTIPPEHKLPVDFIVGHIRYRAGVKLETVRAAAERWYNYARAASHVDGDKLRELVEQINDSNRHPET